MLRGPSNKVARTTATLCVSPASVTKSSADQGLYDGKTVLNGGSASSTENDCSAAFESRLAGTTSGAPPRPTNARVASSVSEIGPGSLPAKVEPTMTPEAGSICAMVLPNEPPLTPATVASKWFRLASNVRPPVCNLIRTAPDGSAITDGGESATGWREERFRNTKNPSPVLTAKPSLPQVFIKPVPPTWIPIFCH